MQRRRPHSDSHASKSWKLTTEDEDILFRRPAAIPRIEQNHSLSAHTAVLPISAGPPSLYVAPPAPPHIAYEPPPASPPPPHPNRVYGPLPPVNAARENQRAGADFISHHHAGLRKTLAELREQIAGMERQVGMMEGNIARVRIAGRDARALGTALDELRTDLFLTRERADEITQELDPNYIEPRMIRYK
jgi:hypothetical protein